MDDIFSENVLSDYDEGVPIKKIIAQHNLDISVHKFSKKIPPLLYDEKCIFCNWKMVLKKRKRVKIGINNPPKCLECGHEALTYCNCKNCENLRETERLNQRKAEFEVLKSWINKESKDEIEFKEKLLIISFIKSYADEEFCFSRTIKEPIIPMFPRTVYLIDLLNPLIEKGWFFTLSVPEYYMHGYSEIGFEEIVLSPKIEGDISDFVESFNDNELCKSDHESILELEKWLINNEILEILNYQLSKAKFSFRPGTKTLLLVSKLAKNFALEEISYIIHTAIKNTSLFVRENPRSKRHEYNTFIYTLERYIEKNTKSKWDMKNCFLPNEIQRSSLRYVLESMKNGR